MSPWRRCIWALLVATALPVYAQTYPARPLRIIVPYPPGASTDFTAHLMGQRLTEALGQSVVVENRGGAGGIIAAELGARAVPDGYTLFFGTPAALCIAPAMRAKVPYDTLAQAHTGCDALAPRHDGGSDAWEPRLSARA